MNNPTTRTSVVIRMLPVYPTDVHGTPVLASPTPASLVPANAPPYFFFTNTKMLSAIGILRTLDRKHYNNR